MISSEVPRTAEIKDGHRRAIVRMIRFLAAVGVWLPIKDLCRLGLPRTLTVGSYGFQSF